MQTANEFLSNLEVRANEKETKQKEQTLKGLETSSSSCITRTSGKIEEYFAAYTTFLISNVKLRYKSLPMKRLNQDAIENIFFSFVASMYMTSQLDQIRILIFNNFVSATFST